MPAKSPLRAQILDLELLLPLRLEAPPFAKSPLDPAVLAWSLGAGESAVLTVAKTLGGVAVLDDYEARVAPRALGVRLTGTVGIVLAAARAVVLLVLPSSSAHSDLLDCEWMTVS